MISLTYLSAFLSHLFSVFLFLSSCSACHSPRCFYSGSWFDKSHSSFTRLSTSKLRTIKAVDTEQCIFSPFCPVSFLLFLCMLVAAHSNYPALPNTIIYTVSTTSEAGVRTVQTSYSMRGEIRVSGWGLMWHFLQRCQTPNYLHQRGVWTPGTCVSVWECG